MRKITNCTYITLDGVGAVTRLMIQHGLRDEMRLWVLLVLAGGTNRTDFSWPAQPSRQWDCATQRR